jgi:hypothetical protein
MKMTARHQPFLIFVFALIGVPAFGFSAGAQEPRSAEAKADNAKKANARPTEATVDAPEPFDGAPVEKMAAQCVSLETELGAIEIEMIPEVAPESVRSFLNLAATGALDTTTFSRVVKDFVIQGGNLSTSENGDSTWQGEWRGNSPTNRAWLSMFGASSRWRGPNKQTVPRRISSYSSAMATIWMENFLRLAK